jgi:hypothetical protein
LALLIINVMVLAGLPYTAVVSKGADHLHPSCDRSLNGRQAAAFEFRHLPSKKGSLGT